MSKKIVARLILFNVPNPSLFAIVYRCAFANWHWVADPHGPYESAAEAEENRRDIAGWSAICKNVMAMPLHRARFFLGGAW